MHTKHKYLLKNTIVFTVSSFATKILSFFFVPLYTSILTKAEYGYSDIVTNTTTLLVYIFTLNICDSVVRFTIEGKERPLRILAIALRILAIGSVLCFAPLVIISSISVFSWPRYCYLFVYLIFLGTALNGILLSYARGIDEIKKVAFSGIISASVTMGSNVIFLVVFDMRLFGYLLSAFFGIIASIIYLWVYLHISFKDIIAIERCDKKFQKQMINYSVPLIFNGIAWWLNSAFDRYSISFLRGVEENGLYSAATKIPVILVTVNGIFGQAWGLSAIKDIDEEDKDGFFSNTYNMYNCILVTVGSCLICLNIPISYILFSKEFFEAWHFSSILIVSTVFSALSSILGGAFTRTMKTDIYAKTSIFSTTINIVLNILLIQWLGTIGAAIATAASFAFLWLTRFIMARRYVTLNAYIFKHSVSYTIILLQVILEHSIKRFSCFQLVLVLLIFVLYMKEIKKMIQFFTVYFKKIMNKISEK